MAYISANPGDVMSLAAVFDFDQNVTMTLVAGGVSVESRRATIEVRRKEPDKVEIEFAALFKSSGSFDAIHLDSDKDHWEVAGPKQPLVGDDIVEVHRDFTVRMESP